MKTEEVASPNSPEIEHSSLDIQQALSSIQTELHKQHSSKEVQQALSSIQSELYKHRGAFNRIERRLTDIVWFVIIFFVLNLIAQQVLGL